MSPLSVNETPFEGTTFILESDGHLTNGLCLIACAPGSRSGQAVIWRRQFETPEDADAIMDAVYEEDDYGLDFIGHLAISFGSQDLNIVRQGACAQIHDRQARSR